MLCKRAMSECLRDNKPNQSHPYRGPVAPWKSLAFSNQPQPASAFAPANACAYALIPRHKFSQIFMVTVTCLWLGHVKIILDRRQTSNHVGHKSNAGLSDCSLGSESSGHAGFRKALNRFPPCLCASICHTGGEHVRIARSLVVLGGRQLRRWRPFSAPAALQAHPSRD